MTPNSHTVSRCQASLRKHYNKLGSLEAVVTVLQRHPEFETISKATIWNWMNIKKGQLRIGRMLRAVEILNGRPTSSPEKISCLRREVIEITAGLREVRKQTSELITRLEHILRTT